MSKEPMLKVVNVSKSFGGMRAVNNVSFNLFKGEILGIIGPNGSGKTTLINVITGFVRPSSGRVYYKGREVTGWPPHRIASLGVVRTFQMVRPFLSLPAYKNLIIPLYSPRAKKMAVAGKFGDRDAVSMDLMEDVGFERDSSVPYKPAAALPHGYLKRLELARCLALKPELLITDELFSGLSMAEVASIIPTLEKLQMSGITLIMVEHRLRELFRLADRVIVLEYGEKIAEGSPEEVVSNERVKQAYLGVEVG